MPHIASQTRCPRGVAPRRRLRGPSLGILLVLVLLSGCRGTEYVTVRSTPGTPFLEQLVSAGSSQGAASQRTKQLMRRYALTEQYEQDPDAALEELQRWIDKEPTAEKYFSSAELSYLRGLEQDKKNQKKALENYEVAVTNAYIYLFDNRFGMYRNPYDPQYRAACDIYNGALEQSLRLLAKEGGLQPGATHQLQTQHFACDIQVVNRGPVWSDDEFERFEFVSDFEVQGLTNQYRTFGLGVPLIAVRRGNPESSQERYYPPGLSVPVTAFMRLLPPAEGESASHRRAVLELHDPLIATDVQVGSSQVPLESDLSTPLAYFLEGAKLDALATVGLLRPDKSDWLTGLYMIGPYEPGKIPVIMVHGLWSSPITWMEMFNDLRSDPQLRGRYQFWFYLYPTGQPFLASAANLRNDLNQMRVDLDPSRQQPALDQIVLVGHSMGGLVSKLQTVDGGDPYWQAVSHKPLTELDTDEQLRMQLENTFYFRANPSVRRVVTIGTPHRGSHFANSATQWLGRKLITLPSMLTDMQRQLTERNPDAFDKASGTMKTSIDSLSPKSPILPVLLSSAQPPSVQHHNIVGVVGKQGKDIDPNADGDGIVNYASATLDNVASQVIVDAEHQNVHRHPLSILEVRRILLDHLQSLEQAPHSPFQLIRNQPNPPAVGYPLVPQGAMPYPPTPQQTTLPGMPPYGGAPYGPAPVVPHHSGPQARLPAYPPAAPAYQPAAPAYQPAVPGYPPRENAAPGVGPSLAPPLAMPPQPYATTR